MSNIQKAISRIKEASYDVTLTKLAADAGVPKSTARGLLKDGHSAVANLLKLEAAAEKHLAPKEAGPI